MARKPARDHQPVLKPSGALPAGNPDAPNADLRQRILAPVAQFGAGWMLSFLGILIIGMAAVLLSVAWQFGPKVLLDRNQFASYTGRTEGHIVESWLAVEVDVGSIKHAEYWRASASASPCAVVEIDGDWGAPVRRAFCGTRLGFNDNYDLAPVRELAPGVPFAWARDEHGFAVPEVRLSAGALDYLAKHDTDTFMHSKWPAKTALAWLKVGQDRPLDTAIVGWTASAPTLPLAFDPKAPAAALPLGILEARAAHSPSILAVVFGVVVGLPLWLLGMAILPVTSGTLMEGMASRGRWILAVVPLLALPWWAEYLPRTIASFNPQWAEVIGDMLNGIDPLDRLVASTPDKAVLATGERVTWTFGNSVYADTFGRFRYARPASPLPTEDAALAALVAGVTAQFAALDPADQVALLERLKRDKLADLQAVGLAFLPAVKHALTDPQSPPPVQRAARAFLTEWSIEPTVVVDKRDPGYQERLRLKASVKDLR